MKTGTIRRLPQGSDYSIHRIIENPLGEEIIKAYFVVKENIFDTVDSAVISCEITPSVSSSGKIEILEDGNVDCYFYLSNLVTSYLYRKQYHYGIVIEGQSQRLMIEKGKLIVKNSIL